MGAPKQKWTPEEEDALRAGVDKHGAGKWRTIQKDPEFVHFLSARSNIDLKDKWRNMSVSASGQGSREKSSRPKTKAITAVPSNGSEVTTCLAGALVALDSPIAINPEPSKTSHDTKPPRYTAMIMEAFSALRDSNGSDISDISKFIEQRYEVPTTFKRLLSSKLRRLIAQDKIEKVQNGYRLKEASFATKNPTPKQKDPVQRLRQPQIPGLSASWDMVEEAAVAAAYKIADAEAKSFLLSESVKEVERITRMVEESETMLQFAQELYERCSKGEIIMLP